MSAQAAQSSTTSQPAAAASNTMTVVQSVPQAVQMPQVPLDPEFIRHQKTNSLQMLDSELKMVKERTKAEFESQKQVILMRAEHDLAITGAAIEQSKQQQLFSLDQQHQQRKMEIQQKAQEQRMQIETTANQLIMTARQQQMEKEMSERMAKLQAALPPQPQQFVSTQPGSNSYVPPPVNGQVVNGNVTYTTVGGSIPAGVSSIHQQGPIATTQYLPSYHTGVPMATYGTFNGGLPAPTYSYYSSVIPAPQGQVHVVQSNGASQQQQQAGNNAAQQQQNQH